MYKYKSIAYKLEELIFLEKTADCWELLSKNPSATHLVEQNKDKVEMERSFKNTNNRSFISSPEVFRLIGKRKVNRLNLFFYLRLPFIFEKITYEEMRETRSELHREFFEWYYNPSRLRKFADDE